MARDPSTPGPQVSIHTISVGSINDMGESVYFMEKCASTMAVVLSGGISDIKAKRDYSNKPKNLVVSRRCICFLVLIINKRRRLAHETKYRKRKDLSPKNYM